MKRYFLLILTLFYIGSNAQSYEQGKTIFDQNCASCHQMDKKMVGPKLMNVVDEQGADWVYQWVKNNKELRASGDEHANQIYEDYGGAAMPVYDYLGKEKLNSVVKYLSEWQDKSMAKEPEVQAEGPKASRPSGGSGYTFPTWFKVVTGVVCVFILVVFYLLFDVIKTLAKQKDDKTDE
jgi:cytochrome c2